MSTSFYIDRKVTVWVRELHDIGLSNYDNAVSVMKKCFDSDDTDDTFVTQEIIYDTMEYIDKEENGGNPVMELYDESFQLLQTK